MRVIDEYNLDVLSEVIEDIESLKTRFICGDVGTPAMEAIDVCIERLELLKEYV